MRKTIQSGIGIVLVTCLFCSCTTYNNYSRQLGAGKSLLSEGRYDEARRHLEDAARHNIDGAAYTYLALMAYRHNDLGSALGFIASAEKAPPDMLSSLRMYACKALILLGLKAPGGMKALQEYVDRYDGFYPLESINDIKEMLRTGTVDRERLETIMEEQLQTHEQDMELYIYSNVGFYTRDNRDGAY